MISKYQELAERTLVDLGGQGANGAHMALGIVTEVEEMLEAMREGDSVGVKEEHGDCLWYIANECNIYNIDFRDLCKVAGEITRVSFESLHYLGLQINSIVSNIADIHKKELAYGKEVDVVQLSQELIRLLVVLVEVSRMENFDFESSLETNISKLSFRYPEKFTQANALNRDLEKERKILEK